MDRPDHALADLDRLTPADWLARYGAELRELLTGRASQELESELELTQKEADYAEARAAQLETWAETHAANLRQIVGRIEKLVETDQVSDPLEALDAQLSAIAEQLFALENGPGE